MEFPKSFLECFLQKCFHPRKLFTKIGKKFPALETLYALENRGLLKKVSSSGCGNFPPPKQETFLGAK